MAKADIPGRPRSISQTRLANNGGAMRCVQPGKLVLCLLWLFCLGLAGGVAQAQSGYAWTDLGTLGGYDGFSNYHYASVAFAINDNGQVVGYARAADGS